MTDKNTHPKENKSGDVKPMVDTRADNTKPVPTDPEKQTVEEAIARTVGAAMCPQPSPESKVEQERLQKEKEERYSRQGHNIAPR